MIEQYGALVGLPTWQPYWAFGFQLCRWGYKNIEETREQVQRMREAGIPLEVMWNDIDLYHAYRDFTSDPVSFDGDTVREFIRELVRDFLGARVQCSDDDELRSVGCEPSAVCPDSGRGHPPYCERYGCCECFKRRQLWSTDATRIVRCIHPRRRTVSTRALLDLINALNDVCSAHGDVWQKNPDGSEYIGKVWPGYTVRSVSVH